MFLHTHFVMVTEDQRNSLSGKSAGLEQQLKDPAIFADQKLFADVSREYSEVTNILEKLQKLDAATQAVADTETYFPTTRLTQVLPISHDRNGKNSEKRSLY